MTHTGIDSIDRTVHKTNDWLAGIMGELRTDDRKLAYTALRSVLHALRDKLPLGSVAGLAAQLPVLVRGVYYEGWQPEHSPVHVRSLEEFLTLVARDLPQGKALEPEPAARAVFHVLEQHLDPNETEKIIRLLPKPLHELWRGAPSPRDN